MPLRWIARAAAIMAIALTPVAAQAAKRSYPASTAEIVNPERGFWRFASDDFAKVTQGELSDIRAAGLSMAYAVVRLDEFRNKPLSKRLLNSLDLAFAKTRRSGLKLILRFTYNYPENEHDYLNAKDAPLAIVLRHLTQLKPTLERNADVVAVLQAGFIGAWGEGHTSSNRLTTPANKATIRDALLAVLPEGRMLQWRYPGDVINWSPAPPPAGELARIGLHNDCFMSSTTDVGTYSERPKVREAQRAYAADLSRATLFGGETCDVGSGSERMTCADILAEGADFHLTTLNRDYSAKFIAAWRRGGCLDEVARAMGYRLVLKAATAPERAQRGDVVRAVLRLRNEGWARLYNPRPFRLVAVHRDSGRRFVVETAGDIRAVEPELPAPTRFRFAWRVPADAPAGVYDLAAALPDAAPSLGEDPAYAVRFANGSGSGFGWDGGTGSYRLGLTVTVGE